MRRSFALLSVFAFLLSLSSADEPIIAPLDKDAEASMMINFQETPLETVLSLYAEVTGHSIMFSPKVAQVNLSGKTEERKTPFEIALKIEALLKAEKITILPFTNRLAIVHPVGAVPEPPLKRLGRPQSAEDKPTINLAFSQAPLDTVLFTYFNLVEQDLKISENLIQTPISFRSVRPLTPKEAIHTLEVLLYLHRIELKKGEGDSVQISGPTKRAAVPGRGNGGQAINPNHFQMEVRRKGLPLLPVQLPEEKVRELESQRPLDK